jgi:hypothetical protein
LSVSPGRFSWWDTHDKAWRRARLLFVLAGLVVAIYAAGILVVVGASLRVAGVGPWHRIEAWVDDIGPVGVVFVVLVLLGVVALATMGIGWRGLPRTTLRLSRARPPDYDEERQVGAVVAAFALAYGMPSPRVWIVDDPAPNGLAFGRPGAGNVCVTTGAVRLAHDERDALCMFQVTSLASRVFAYATSAADLVLVGEWCTRLLWSAAAIVIFSTVVGVPIGVALAYVVGIAVVVAVTRPLLLLADRGLVRLIDETAELVDLETIRHSAQPESLAHLLLGVLEDRRQVKSRWEIAHLWFERDVVDVDDRNTFVQLLATFAPAEVGIPAFAARCTRGTRRGLLERAETAVDLANGDAKLRARLGRARTVTGPR